MAAFSRYIGIDYSGALTPEAPLTGLRAFVAAPGRGALEALPEAAGLLPEAGGPLPEAGRPWSRRGLALWLEARLREPTCTLVGVDHNFSLPLAYFDAHGLARDWHAFLVDFQRHWPTDLPGVRVEDVRQGRIGQGADRGGNSRWRRLAERLSPGAKSAFHFDVPGSVAKSTHAGLPWLLYLRQRLGPAVHFWPFDGWQAPAGRSVIAEAYPALWKMRYRRADLGPDQNDAFAVASWLADADRTGALARAFIPALPAAERAVAQIEGWIIGVEYSGYLR